MRIGAGCLAGVLTLCIGSAHAAGTGPPPGAAACSGCHPGHVDAAGSMSRLAGRNPAEIVAAIQAFRSGGRPATVMDRIARGFSDAEIEAIAAWYADQR